MNFCSFIYLVIYFVVNLQITLLGSAISSTNTNLTREVITSMNWRLKKSEKQCSDKAGGRMRSARDR